MSQEVKMLGIEGRWNKCRWDVLGKVVLNVVGTSSLSLRLESWEEVGSFVVTLSLDLSGSQVKTLWKLGTKIVAEGLLGEVFKLVSSKLLHAGREFILSSWENEVLSQV